MLARLLENWLDSSSERAFQAPFCAILVSEGHTLLHSTRHCGMELGKDIISIAPDGVPCAFQLKSASSGKLGLRHWRDEISQQVIDLVNLPVRHPSLPQSPPWHRAYLVTNGEIEEEMSRAIDDLNAGWSQRGHPELHLHVISRGQFLHSALLLGEALWPSEPFDLKTFLEFLIEDGTARLDRKRFAFLIEVSLLAHEDDAILAPTSTASRRRLSAGVILCAHALSTFHKQGNHVAEVYGWTIFAAYVLLCAEKWKIGGGGVSPGGGRGQP